MYDTIYDEKTGVRTMHCNDGQIITHETVTAAKVKMLPWQERMCFHTRNRYKVPTCIIVKLKSSPRRWRRLYTFADGNNPPVYVNVNGDMHFILNSLEINDMASKED